MTKWQAAREDSHESINAGHLINNNVFIYHGTAKRQNAQKCVRALLNIAIY
jgi:hypothetical protein